MCNNLVCEVCGGQAVGQRLHNTYSVTLCDDHFNELHRELQFKEPRAAMVKFHKSSQLRNTFFGLEEGIEDKEGFNKVLEERLNEWMDAEHKYFLVTDGIVKGMKKAYKKKEG